MILLTRKADFAAAHFYWNNKWSPEKNTSVFGKCANRNGHGHNYTLEVTVAGEVDPVTGFVVDLKKLKDVMHAEVVEVYDHRHLNHEVPEFHDRMPTAENMAISIWERLEQPVMTQLPGAKLQRVRVYEMADLFADYYGPDADGTGRP
jgi:6-pyruvoyltetrahydropterin/6-carboxytetrahydropterin synthase